ncbi:MAG: LysM peptidoglycan-binding domain-containing protein, partial [Oscillospiraceae bacterium]
TALNKLSGKNNQGLFANYKATGTVTREQMAVIISNYAKAMGVTLPKVYAENTFADNAKISSNAKNAVKQMQMSGVISSKDAGKFDPQSTATRAEVSAMLKRFVEVMIDESTSKGWIMNDSGKWMYFENGKAVIGNKKIDGVNYKFDQYGIVAEAPKLSYDGYTVQKGDSFWRIARKYRCSMFELAKINDKTIFSMIRPGDVLKVPKSK